MTDKPRILIFTGDGKGKTTAALGMALRAVGHGLSVQVIQFIKADPRTGELLIAPRLPGFSLVQTGRGFVPPSSDPRFPKHQAAAREGLALAARTLASPPDLLILDELCLAVALNLVSESDVLALLAQARPPTVLALTGRGATPALIAAADTVTEMKPLKHLFDSGSPAADKGVEF